MSQKFIDCFDTFAWRFVAIVLAIALTIMSYKMTTASGQIAFCYIDTLETPGGIVNRLMGHKDWRPHVVIVRDPTSTQRLIEVAQEIECPLKL